MINGMITIRNDFHNTETKTKVIDGIISESKLKRVEKTLCGMSDCTCGSIRGTQDHAIEIKYNYDGRYAQVFEI